MRIFEQIYNGSRTKFGCLKVLKAILSSSGESFLGVLLLLKISRNLVLQRSKSFKTSCEFIFFQIRINFLKKSSNFNYLSFGSRMQTVALPWRGLGRRVPSVNVIFDFDIFLNIKGIV